jgi:hypothetical protein
MVNGGVVSWRRVTGNHHNGRSLSYYGKTRPGSQASMGFGHLIKANVIN